MRAHFSRHTTPSSRQPHRHCSCSRKVPAYIPVDFHLRCQGTSLTQNETWNLAVGGGLKLHGSFDSVTALHCCCRRAKASLSTASSPPHRIMFVDSFSLLWENTSLLHYLKSAADQWCCSKLVECWNPHNIPLQCSQWWRVTWQQALKQTLAAVGGRIILE